jgi:hypothetical protein
LQDYVLEVEDLNAIKASTQGNKRKKVFGVEGLRGINIWSTVAGTKMLSWMYTTSSHRYPPIMAQKA